MDYGERISEILGIPMGHLGITRPYTEDERDDLTNKGECFWRTLRERLSAEGLESILPYCDEKNPDSGLLKCYIMYTACCTQLPIDTIRICTMWTLKYPEVYKCKKGSIQLLDSVFYIICNKDTVAFTKLGDIVLNVFESVYKDIFIPYDSILYLFNEKMSHVLSTVDKYKALQPVFRSGVGHYGKKMMALHDTVYHLAIADHSRFGRLLHLLELTGADSVSACLNPQRKFEVTPQKVMSKELQIEVSFFELQGDDSIDYIGCLIAALGAVADVLNSSGGETSYF